MIRRTLLLLALSLVLVPPAAADDDDPVAVVRERGAWRIADIRSNGMQPDGMLTRILRKR